MTAESAGEMDLDGYCRQIESHLCRKNDGHLIRVSGPAFEMVRGWAEQGIPLGVAKAGIDRTFERYYARGPRRRPVHISFCEADVLDAFDAWRRALGAPMGGGEETADLSRRPSRSESLPAHLERVVNRLTRLRGPATDDRELDEALEAAVRAIDAERAQASQARGDARAALLGRLAAIDERLVDLARARLSPDREAELRQEADAELAAFRERMPADAYEAARRAALARLVRAASGLPLIRYEA
jgi:hypothetical protein